MTLALILVVLISGCKKNDYQAAVGVCPLVVSTIPANGAVAVPLNQVVSATFNEKMNAATITSSTFTVIDATKSAGLKAAVVVTGTLTYSGMTSFFTPSSPLSPNTTYTGRMTTAARDLTGNALQADYVWTFTTDLPPTATSDPANNATGVLLNKVIVATFSAPMDSATLKSPATIFTIKQGTTTVPGKFSYTSTTASFTPTSNLAPFTVYTGTITTGAKNKLGTPMAADYVWNFTTIPQLTLSSNPAHGGTTSGAGVFAQGSSVTVVATANLGYTFFNWTEGTTVVSTSASYQFAMAGNRTLVANFTPKYLVTVLSVPVLGGTTSGGGSFTSGTTVIVTAVPNAGFTFTNWTEGASVVSTSANYSFSISGNRTLSANYTAVVSFNVTVSSNPLAGGSSTGGGSFVSGASVTVSANANTGYTFTNWTEGVNIVSSSANYTFAITGSRILVANYTLIGGFNVTVSSNPLIGGSTTGGGSFVSGASVTVSANANTGYTFTNWTEGANIVSSSANYTFTITASRILVANYTLNGGFNVTVSSNPLIGGSTTGGGSFNSGASVTVSANANTGYTFTNWTEGVNIVSSSANYTFTITANRILVANFASSLPLGPGLVNLGTSGDFTALAMSGISTTGVTSVAGDIGVSPVAATGITGFGLIMDTNGQSSHTPIVSGKVYASDYAPPTPAKMTTAVNDMMTAYTTANGLTTGVINEIYAGNISGQTLPPGLYKWGTGLLISNAGVTLSGGANDTWVFQIAQDLTVNSSAIVTLIGGAQAKNIFWVVAGQALLGPGVDFSGIILSKTLISLNTGAKVTGKLLAQTAVTLNASTVVQP